MADLGDKTKFFRLPRANCAAPSLSLRDSDSDDRSDSEEESEEESSLGESCASASS